VNLLFYGNRCTGSAYVAASYDRHASGCPQDEIIKSALVIPPVMLLRSGNSIK
jgi:hypothetical protein